MVDVAEVRIWGELAGAVRWEADRQLASFQYDKKFLGKEIELSPIKMPVQNGSRIYRFPELRRARNESAATFKGLPGLLADALPDRYGNQLINIRTPDLREIGMRLFPKNHVFFSVPTIS